jgi:hypothetical protein
MLGDIFCSLIRLHDEALEFDHALFVQRRAAARNHELKILADRPAGADGHGGGLRLHPRIGHAQLHGAGRNPDQTIATGLVGRSFKRGADNGHPRVVERAAIAGAHDAAFDHADRSRTLAVGCCRSRDQSGQQCEEEKK